MPNLQIPDLGSIYPRVPYKWAWQHYLALPNEELAKLDIAAVNLQCSCGLPESDRIDVPGCLAKINSWVPIVRRWTDAAYRQYFLADPGQFRNSEAFFRIVSLVTCLQRHCGVRYDPAKAGATQDDSFDFDELFIHGIVQGKGGTCATLPIIFASVGRKLGYPIKLVTAPAHLFCRWDNPITGERWNIEGTATEEGFSSYPDDHYRQGEYPITRFEDERAYGFLESMTPRRELADFMGQRGHAFELHHRYRESLEIYAQAARLSQPLKGYPQRFMLTLAAWKKHLQKRTPKQFPRLNMMFRADRQRWPFMPWHAEREFIALDSHQTVLDNEEMNHEWWKPLRRGKKPLKRVPESIEIDNTNLVYDEPF